MDIGRNVASPKYGNSGVGIGVYVYVCVCVTGKASGSRGSFHCVWKKWENRNNAELLNTGGDAIAVDY